MTFFKTFDLVRGSLNINRCPFKGIHLFFKGENETLREVFDNDLNTIKLIIGGNIVTDWRREFLVKDATIIRNEGEIQVCLSFPTLSPSIMKHVPIHAVIEFSKEPSIDVYCRLEKLEQDYETHIKQRHIHEFTYVVGERCALLPVLDICEDWTLTFDGLEHMSIRLDDNKEVISKQDNIFHKNDLVSSNTNKLIPFEIITPPGLTRIRMRCILEVKNQLIIEPNFTRLRYSFDKFIKMC